MLQSWLQPGHNKKKFTRVFKRKQMFNFIYLFIYSGRIIGNKKNKLLQLLHHLKMGFWEKIIQSKTFENTHVSPWANF